MQIVNLNPDADIGASAWLATLEGRSVLLDAGTHPRREGMASLPMFDAAPGVEPDAIVVSHCHLDHVGGLPSALRRHPHARVLMSDASYFLIERVLHNSVNVMMRQRDEAGIADYPLYTHEEVDEYAAVFEGVPWRQPVRWAASHTGRRGAGFTVELFEAGHTLGAAGALVRSPNHSLFYTGDVCFHDQTLSRAARFKDVRAETVIVETTRGGKSTPRGFSRAAEVQRLAAAVQKVQARRGCVLIPSFALGRTQEILASLALLMREGALRRQPIYIGGLGRVFTEIYDLQARRHHRHHPDLRLTRELELIVVSPPEVDRMPIAGRILVLTSGMVALNTAAHAAARRLAGNPRNAVYFVGYTDPDSPGGRLRAAGRGGVCVLDPADSPLEVECEVEAFDLTAHAHREAILHWLVQTRPKTAVLGHGDAAAREWFKASLQRRCPGMRVVCPGPGELVSV